MPYFSSSKTMIFLDIDIATLGYKATINNAPFDARLLISKLCAFD